MISLYVLFIPLPTLSILLIRFFECLCLKHCHCLHHIIAFGFGGSVIHGGTNTESSSDIIILIPFPKHLSGAGQSSNIVVVNDVISTCPVFAALWKVSG